MSAWNENGKEDALGATPLPMAPCRGVTEDQLERLKEHLLMPLVAPIENIALVQELRWVANEAAALAWLTICPALVMPILLEEKICAALTRWERQQHLWNSTKASQSTSAKAECPSTFPRLGSLPTVAFPSFSCLISGPFAAVQSEAFIHG